MGRMILILVLGLSGIFALFSLNNMRSDTRVINSIIDYYDKTQARNLAASGIDIAIKELSLNKSWTGKELSPKIGRLIIKSSATTSQYPNGPSMGLTDHYEIESIGIVDGKEDTVRAVIKAEENSGGDPEFFKYSMLCGGQATMNGNVNITDDGNPTWNSDFHTNSNLQMNGSNLIKGFGTYTGNLTSNVDMNATFMPNDNPSGDPSYYQSDSVNIPDFNASDYAGIATNTSPGNLIIETNQTLGTESNPTIYYINGDLTLRNNATISGYGILIVTGNVICEANTTISSPYGNKNNLAIFSNGDINLHDNVSVTAQLLSKYNINFGNNSNLYGLATARGLFNFNGTVNIHYRPSNSVLTEPLWESDSGGRAQVVSYYE